MLVDGDVGEEMVPEEIGMVARRRAEALHDDALGCDIGEEIDLGRGCFGCAESAEIESPHVDVTPFLALRVGVVELLEDVKGVHASFGQPAGLRQRGREVVDRRACETRGHTGQTVLSGG